MAFIVWKTLNLLCIYVDQRKPGQILRENQGKTKWKTKNQGEQRFFLVE